MHPPCSLLKVTGKRKVRRSRSCIFVMVVNHTRVNILTRHVVYHEVLGHRTSIQKLSDIRKAGEKTFGMAAKVAAVGQSSSIPALNTVSEYC
jgi:hypothetical protein